MASPLMTVVGRIRTSGRHTVTILSKVAASWLFMLEAVRPRRATTAVDLFSGIGTLTVAAKEVGLQVLLGVVWSLHFYQNTTRCLPGPWTWPRWRHGQTYIPRLRIFGLPPHPAPLVQVGPQQGLV